MVEEEKKIYRRCMKVKIAIADDHRIVREGIKAMLQEEGWIELVGEAADGEEVLELLERKEIDIILLDIDMPGMDGIACLRLIRKYWPETRVLMVSMHTSEKFVVDAFRSGAAGYISKDTCTAEMANAIQALAQGNSYFSQEVSRKLHSHLNKPMEDRKALRYREEPLLTSRETEVLILIAREFTNQEIADRLFISPHTVVSHRRNLLQKLNAKNTAGLVHQAARHGLLQYDQ